MFRIKIRTLFIIFSVTCSCFGAKVLRQAHVLYRHGDRSPVSIFPKDEHADFWPDGLGRLTQKGMRMEYELGKFMRSRYLENSFLNRSYLHKEVYCKSSDVERCLMSAESQMAGLYPPSGWQIWNKNISWQPVPVHTVPGHQDPFLRPWDYHCPRLSELLNEKKTSKEYIEMQEKNHKLLSYLEKNTGMKGLTLNSIWSIRDTLFVEKSHDLSMPSWLTDDVWSRIDGLYFWGFKFRLTGGDEFSRLSGGSLIKKMIERMEKMSQMEKAFKLNIYSAHDTTVVALLGSMGLYNGTDVPYSVAVIVELYELTPGNHVVEIYLRNSTTAPPYKLNLNGCAAECPLPKFVSLLQKRVPSDLDEECGNSIPSASRTVIKKDLSLVVGLGIVSVLLLIILLVVLVQRRLRKSSKHSQYFQGLNQDENPDGVYLYKRECCSFCTWGDGANFTEF